MIFKALAIPGAYEIRAQPHRDDRGSFARIYCPDEFAVEGIPFASTQLNISENVRRLTLRGLHYKRFPYAETKVVHAVRGRAFDVIVDLRPDSVAYKKWSAVELASGALNAVFVPEGCAHGFLTLEDDTAILYQMGRVHAPGHDEGVRWNDPAFGITWPAPPEVISDRDATYPDFG